MGILNRVLEAASQANEDAHASRLERGLHDTRAGLAQLGEGLRVQAFREFLETRARLQPEIANWSREGKIKIGRELQNEARKAFDFDQAKSYGSWMAGAWLEGQARPSDRARNVYQKLEKLANHVLAGIRDSSPRDALRQSEVAAGAALRKPAPDAMRLRKAVEEMYWPLLKVYVLGDMHADVDVDDLRQQIPSSLTRREKMLMSAVLCGIWHQILEEQHAVTDKKVVATSVAWWLGLPLVDSLRLIDQIADGTAEPAVSACSERTSRALRRLRETQDAMPLLDVLQYVKSCA